MWEIKDVFWMLKLFPMTAIMRLYTNRMIRKLTVLFLVMFTMVSFMPLLRTFLPTALQRVDTYHLARLALDWQRFPVNSQTIGGDNSMIPVKVDRQMIHKHLVNMGPLPDKQKYENDSLLFDFMPIMTIKDREHLLLAFEAFVRACEWGNLTYFLWGGSMLGAYRHHGFIPWDDDMDLVMNGSDWRNVRNVLSRVPGYGLNSPSNVQWKFYKSDLKPNPFKPYKWPFLDIFFFTEDSTYLWALTHSIKNELLIRKDDIFPIQLRQFEHIKVAVPRKMEEIVIRTYGVRDCQTVSYSHKNDRQVMSADVKNIPCRYMHSIYPFVFREKYTSSKIILETLKLGTRVLRNMTIPQSSQPAR